MQKRKARETASREVHVLLMQDVHTKENKRKEESYKEFTVRIGRG
jgi:hypothetical protein